MHRLHHRGSSAIGEEVSLVLSATCESFVGQDRWSLVRLDDPNHDSSAAELRLLAKPRISRQASSSSLLVPRGELLVELGEGLAVVVVELGLAEDRGALAQELVDPLRAGAVEPEQVAGQELVDTPAADDLELVVNGDEVVAGLTAEHRDVGVLGGLDDERAVGRDDELGAREAAVEKGDELALPARVEVEIDLVDEAHGWLGERVLALGVAGEHSHGEVDDPGHQRSVAEGEIGDVDPAEGGAGAKRGLGRVLVEPGDFELVDLVGQEVEEGVADAIGASAALGGAAGREFVAEEPLLGADQQGLRSMINTVALARIIAVKMKPCSSAKAPWIQPRSELGTAGEVRRDRRG